MNPKTATHIIHDRNLRGLTNLSRHFNCLVFRYSMLIKNYIVFFRESIYNPIKFECFALELLTSCFVKQKQV